MSLGAFVDQARHGDSADGVMYVCVRTFVNEFHLGGGLWCHIDARWALGTLVRSAHRQEGLRAGCASFIVGRRLEFDVERIGAPPTVAHMRDILRRRQHCLESLIADLADATHQGKQHLHLVEVVIAGLAAGVSEGDET